MHFFARSHGWVHYIRNASTPTDQCQRRRMLHDEHARSEGIALVLSFLSRFLLAVMGLALHSRPSLSILPSEVRRKELIALAILNMAQARPKGAAAALTSDCRIVYRGFDGHRINDIAGSTIAARHIATAHATRTYMSCR